MTQSLTDRIKKDLEESLKNKEPARLGTLRMVKSSLESAAIADKKKLPDLKDEDVLKVLKKEARKRQDAIALYNQGGNTERADKEAAELEVIKEYLPAELSAEDVTAKVKEVLANLDSKDFGKVMKAVMAELKGEADGKVVSQIVRQELKKLTPR